MLRPRPLSLEHLDARDMPSASVWGVPWPDGQHLTLSLAPDGAKISGVGSTLSTVLANAGGGSELALLEAFQSWADVANVNFGLVSDGGEAFGVGKAIQDDSRFGDIRVGARPLGSDVIAVTSPFDYFSTYSGDVVLNSAQAIGSAYNLYTVALHEAGHALGLPDNNDPTSVMYEYYNGANGSLSTSDIAAIQALYGARGPNAANNSFATAATYLTPVCARLNSPTDANYYKFSTPLLFTGTTIQLQAEGLSLLDATVSIYSSQGKLVASTTATNPTNNNLTLQLNNLSGLSNYYVAVNSPNGGEFDVGTYNLTISNNLLTAVGSVVDGVVGLLGGVGHTLLTATNLIPNTTAIGGQVNYNARASLNSATDANYFAVQAPASSTGSPATIVADVWTLTNQSLTPRIQVLDSQGNAVSFQALTDTAGTCTIQVPNAVPGARYELEVTSSSGQTGCYSLAVNYLSSPLQFPLTASGTLSSTASSTSASLNVVQSQTMHFVLSAGAVPSDSNTILLMTIVDASGAVVAALQTTAGNAVSLDVFLGVGSYTVTVSETTSDGSALQSDNFVLDAIGITDPVAVAASNPTATTSGSSSSSSSTTTSSSSTTTTTSSSSSSTSSNSTWSSTTPSSTAAWN